MPPYGFPKVGVKDEAQRFGLKSGVRESAVARCNRSAFTLVWLREKEKEKENG